jgi:hypothetical protein
MRIPTLSHIRHVAPSPCTVQNSPSRRSSSAGVSGASDAIAGGRVVAGAK